MEETKQLTDKQVNDISRTIAAMLIESFDAFGFDWSEVSERDQERITENMQKIASRIRGSRPNELGSTTSIIEYFTSNQQSNGDKNG